MMTAVAEVKPTVTGSEIRSTSAPTIFTNEYFNTTILYLNQTHLSAAQPSETPQVRRSNIIISRRLGQSSSRNLCDG